VSDAGGPIEKAELSENDIPPARHEVILEPLPSLEPKQLDPAGLIIKQRSQPSLAAISFLADIYERTRKLYPILRTIDITDRKNAVRSK
jgi:hypothetical protein